LDAQDLEVLNKKILIIQTAFLGDAILTLPLLQRLKEKNSNNSITVLCIPSTKEVFLNSQSVDDVIVYDKRFKDKSLASYIKLIIEVRSREFDRVISPHRSIRSTLISFFAGAENTVGFNTADAAFLYTKQIQYKMDMHEVERNLSLVSNDGELIKWEIFPEIRVAAEAEQKIDRLITQSSLKKIIAIAPGSVWKTKIYPKEYFEELIRLIIEIDYNVVLIGGKEDYELCKSIEQKIGERIVSFAGELSIVESVALLKRCSLLVCNDSAPTHLAMVANIAVLTIFCSTNPGFGFYPYNQKSMSVSLDGLKCKPCGIHGHDSCPIKTFECAYNLRPGMVFEKLLQILPA
jgi:heptosyltransferase-2